MITRQEFNPEAEMTRRRRIATKWALRPARRIAGGLAVAAAMGGATFACRASDIAGPSFSSEKGISKTLTTDGTLIEGDNTDSWPMQPASHNRVTKEEAENDETFRTTPETTFPVSEAVYNICRNELVVLNGFLKRRLRVDADPMLRFQLREFKNTHGVTGSATYDHDGDPTTEPKVVKYNNKEHLLDQFAAGPAQAPFRSEFLSMMHLQREGPDQADYVKQFGDDLFVTVRQIMKIDDKGQTVMKYEFRADCK